MLARVTGLSKRGVTAVAEDFEAIGQSTREMIEQAPTKFERGPPEMNRQDRLDEITKLRNRVRRLQELAEKPEKFSPLPDRLKNEFRAKDWDDLKGLLSALLRHADQLEDCIEDRHSYGLNADSDLRMGLVFRLGEILRNAGLSTARNHNTDQGDAGRAADIIATACKRICGERFSVDDHLKAFNALWDWRKRKEKS